MKVLRKLGRPKKQCFQTAIENLPPLSSETMNDMARALNCEGRQQLQKEVIEGRLEAKRLRQLAEQIESKTDKKEQVLESSDKAVIAEELYNAIIRSWARKKKVNPSGWRREVDAGFKYFGEECCKLTFYGSLSFLIWQSIGLKKEGETIRKAIDRELAIMD